MQVRPRLDQAGGRRTNDCSAAFTSKNNVVLLLQVKRGRIVHDITHMVPSAYKKYSHSLLHIQMGAKQTFQWKAKSSALVLTMTSSIGCVRASSLRQLTHGRDSGPGL